MCGVRVRGVFEYVCVVMTHHVPIIRHVSVFITEAGRVVKVVALFLFNIQGGRRGARPDPASTKAAVGCRVGAHVQGSVVGRLAVGAAAAAA